MNRYTEGLENAGFNHIESFESNVNEYYSSAQDLLFLLKHTPILYDFGVKDEDFGLLDAFIRAHQTERGDEFMVMGQQNGSSLRMAISFIAALVLYVSEYFVLVRSQNVSEDRMQFSARATRSVGAKLSPALIPTLLHSLSLGDELRLEKEGPSWRTSNGQRF